MKSSRRHDSLIPLSREHQYALLLCLRINRGLPVHKEDMSWLQTKAEMVIQFFEGDLTTHFMAEEEVLFPAMRNFSGAAELISELSIEHRKLEALASQLRRIEPELIAATLKDFAALLESHIRKEERKLFPIYEQQASVENTQAVGEGVSRLIGQALHPRNPELLE